jgi:serine/threonine-protein kinase
MALEVGQRIGDYEVLALLGSGGMGRVYKVRNIISNREEAMKILLPDFASEPELAARFMAEIRTLAGLDHPNIAQLRTAFQFQNQLVMIMEFVEGTTLETLAGQGKIPFDQVLDYSGQMLSALSYAHSRGVTHRDIKPANIMITSHGLAKLMDFGIAKSTNDLQLTRPGTTMGSVYYMSPEQVRGGTVDARSDIYSFGVTLYEMLTGRKPFQADTSFSVLNAQLNEAPTPPIQVNPSLSPELNNIVLRAMVKVPDGRFQTAEEFRNALKHLGEPLAATQPAQQAQGFAPVTLGSTVAASVDRTVAAPVDRTVAASVGQTVAASSIPPGSTSMASTVMAPSVSNKSHRGLWIGLGAVAAILALVAVGTLLPRVSMHASPKGQDAQTAGPSPAPVTAGSPQVTPLDSGTPQVTPPAGSQPGNTTAPGTRASAGRPPQDVPRGQRANVSKDLQTTPPPVAPPAPPAGPSPQEVRQARDRMINLDARADAVRSGVQQIRSQQQAQGFDIRGDVLTSLNKMNSFLGEAKNALSQNDLQSANEYMDRADTEVATLEKFLGR